MNQKRLLALFIVLAVLAMGAWEMYVDFYASRAAIIFITAYQLDKVAHLLGGAFVVASILFARGKSTLATVLIVTMAVALLWETFELFYDPKVAYFFEKERSLWFKDFSGDIVAGLVGAVLFFIVWRRKFF